MSNLEMDGGIKIYLREIAKTPLLTREEEFELADRIKKGDKAAREHMIKANLRLVVKIAQDYANYGLPLLDLISEGNIGLMKAVERFDPNKGGKLSTYAAWWIKQSIKRALSNQSKTIRLPVHMNDKIAKMRRVAMVMSEELGREPTDEELAEEVGLDRAKLSFLKSAGMRPASLDAPISDDGPEEFGTIIGDEKASNPAELASLKNMHMQLDDLIEVLDDRELDIIQQRFGLNGQKPKTLEEVAQDYGVTRERIRQLQNIALKKMRRALERRETDQPKALNGQNTDFFGDEDEEGVFQARTIVAPSKKRQITPLRRRGPVVIQQPLGGRFRDTTDRKQISPTFYQEKQAYGPPMHNFHLLTAEQQEIIQSFYGWDGGVSRFDARLAMDTREIAIERGQTSASIQAILEIAGKKLNQPILPDISLAERDVQQKALDDKKSQMPTLEERATLEDVQKEVIDLWFGFNGTAFVVKKGLSFREIAERLHITADTAKSIYDEVMVYLERSRLHISLPKTVDEYEHAVEDAGYAEVLEGEIDTHRVLSDEGNRESDVEKPVPWWKRDNLTKIEPPKHSSIIQIGSPKVPGISQVGSRPISGDRVATILSGVTPPAPLSLLPKTPKPPKEKNGASSHKKEEEAVKIRTVFSSLRNTALRVAQMYWGGNPGERKYSVAEIALELNIEQSNVYYHIRNIRQKIAGESAGSGDISTESPILIHSETLPETSLETLKMAEDMPTESGIDIKDDEEPNISRSENAPALPDTVEEETESSIPSNESQGKGHFPKRRKLEQYPNLYAQCDFLLPNYASYRDVVLLYLGYDEGVFHIERGLSHQEIADKLSLPRGTVVSMYATAFRIIDSCTIVRNRGEQVIMTARTPILPVSAPESRLPEPEIPLVPTLEIAEETEMMGIPETDNTHDTTEVVPVPETTEVETGHSLLSRLESMNTSPESWPRNRDLSSYYRLPTKWLLGGLRASRLLHKEAEGKGIKGADYFDIHVHDSSRYSPHAQALLIRAFMLEDNKYTPPDLPFGEKQ